MFHKAPPRPIEWASKDFYRPQTKKGSGLRRRVEKKSPASALKTGDFTRNTLHSLILEDLSVKNIQAGFLTLGSSYLA
jgi:hypothetical protein